MKTMHFALPLFLLLLSAAAGAEPVGGSEDVFYSSGTDTLAATLSIPDGVGPFPGVVLVHGSGSSDRSNPWTSAYANALVERGIAVIHPDKRGSGASGGAWQEATIVDLAYDAVAGLRALIAHPDVDSSRVGFIGFSQGGHIVPVAATLAPSADFVINISGSVVPMMEQIGDELRMMGQREGLSPSDLETVRRIHDLGTRFVLTGEGWDAYTSVLADAKSGELGRTDVVQGFPEDADSPTWQFLRHIGNFDPLPYWHDVSVPTLFLYGGRDQNVDVFKSADVIEEVLAPTGLPYTLLLFGGNGHALYREDAMDFMSRWIHDGGRD